MGEMWPPQSVKRNRTPCFCRTSAILSPPVIMQLSWGAPILQHPQFPYESA